MPNGLNSIALNLPFSEDYMPSVIVVDESSGLTIPYFNDWNYENNQWESTQNVNVATGTQLTITCNDLDGRLICTYHVTIGG